MIKSDFRGHEDNPCRFTSTNARSADASRGSRSSRIATSASVPPVRDPSNASCPRRPSSSRGPAGTSPTTPRNLARPAGTKARVTRAEKKRSPNHPSPTRRVASLPALLRKAPPQISLPLAALPRNSNHPKQSTSLTINSPRTTGGSPPFTADARRPQRHGARAEDSILPPREEAVRFRGRRGEQPSPLQGERVG